MTSVSRLQQKFFVEALEGEHSFTEIDLFHEQFVKYNNRWCHCQDDEFTHRWKQTIAGKIKKLTWSNRFKVNKDTFLHEVLGPASVKEKLDFLFWKRGVGGLSVQSSSDSEKLWYRAMEAANMYDYRHHLTSEAPSMLHSLIREIPQFFLQLQFIGDDGAEQRMKKKAKSVVAMRVNNSLTLCRHIHYYVITKYTATGPRAQLLAKQCQDGAVLEANCIDVIWVNPTTNRRHGERIEKNNVPCPRGNIRSFQIVGFKDAHTTLYSNILTYIHS